MNTWKNRPLREFESHQSDPWDRQPSNRPIPLQPHIDRRNRERQLLQERQLSIRMRQQQRVKARQRIQVWETGVAVALAMFWTAGAVAGGEKLWSVQQHQRQNLATLSEEVEQLQTRVDRARRKVELGLDPMQSDAAIRENFNYMPYNQLGIVLGEPPAQ